MSQVLKKKWLAEYFLLASIGWSLLVGGTLLWALYKEDQEVMALAYAAAKSALAEDLAILHWASKHGGVYVPKTSEQQSLSWLAHIPDRDVTTTSGLSLTLINPATIVRELGDGQAEASGARVRLTALKYLNPGNAPDIWERKQLEAFDRRENSEVWEVIGVGGRPYLRHLKALAMEPGCEKCHAIQGVAAGGIHGATSVSLPLAPYLQVLETTRGNLTLSHGGIWALGMLAILMLYRSARAHARDNSTAQAIVQFSEDAIIGISADGVIDTWNPGAEKIFGYAESEAVGRTLQFLIPEDLAADAKEMLERIHRGECLEHHETSRVHKSGRRIEVSTTISPILDAQGHFIGVSEIARDVTQKNRFIREEALQKEKLELLIEQRTRELKDALEDARKADQTKDAFLATISHELRTPLNAVIGLAGLVQSGVDESKRADYLKKIIVSGNHLNRIINDLLDLSKIAAGKLEFEHVGFRMRDLVATCVSVISHRALAKGVDLMKDISQDVPDIYIGDPGRIEQILLNLISNAIKFTDTGRIDVSVTVKSRSEDRICLQLCVADTGCGMSEETLRRVFEPFSQADASVSRKHGGTGLGLPICRQLARMMGGDIHASSQEGAGSRFCADLWLELGETSDVADANRSATEVLPAKYKGVRLLVVDDQQMNRDVMEGLLSTVDISPIYASNGAEALDILKEHGPDGFDLVLMDVQMPVMDGLAATREIRSWPGFSGLPIVGMTAHTMEHEKQSCFEAGMSEHMGKPIDCDLFFRMLARFLPEKLHAEGKPVDEASPRENVPSSPSLDSIAGLDVADGLTRFSGKEDRYRHWLGDFVATGEQSVQRIGEALVAGDADMAAKTAHALKGRVGMLGMRELHADVSALEAAVRRAEPAEEILGAVRESVARMCASLAKALDAEKSGASAVQVADRVLWQESYSVGVPHLDEQHKKLVALINQFADCRRDGCACNFHEMLTEMFNYTIEHFRSEEAYLQKIGYPGLGDHIKEHSSFIEQVANLSLAASEGKEDIAGAHEFLKKWLLNHILHSDMDYRHFYEHKH